MYPNRLKTLSVLLAHDKGTRGHGTHSSHVGKGGLATFHELTVIRLPSRSACYSSVVHTTQSATEKTITQGKRERQRTQTLFGTCIGCNS